MIIFIPP